MLFSSLVAVAAVTTPLAVYAKGQLGYALGSRLSGKLYCELIRKLFSKFGDKMDRAKPNRTTKPIWQSSRKLRRLSEHTQTLTVVIHRDLSAMYLVLSFLPPKLLA